MINEGKWWGDILSFDGEGAVVWEAVSNEAVLKIVLEAQKRILEKAIERLEGKKRCSETLYGPGSCIACGEASESGDCVNAVVNDCIKELKSLMGEVDT